MSTANSWRQIPQRYRLEAGQCGQCGKLFYPPRRVCDECGQRTFEPIKLPLAGTLVSYTVIRVSPPEHADLAPYAVGLVELSGGARLECQVVDCDFERLRVGMPVKLEFRRIQEDTEAGMIHYAHKAVPA